MLKSARGAKRHRRDALNKPALRSNATATPPLLKPPGIVMIRFLLRFIGLCLLAAAFVFLVYDGERSIANQHVTYTELEQGWALVDQIISTWPRIG